LLSLLTLQQNCIKAYRKYSDSVAVLSGIYHILLKKPRIADYVGIETKLQNNVGNDLTPDLVMLYEKRTKGLLFELKWSLPFSESLLEKEIKEIKKYVSPLSNWKNSSGKVDYHDLVFVCHVEDAERVINTVSKVAKEAEFKFLNSNSFALWTWSIYVARGGEHKENLVIRNVYGKTRNSVLENMSKKPIGLILPEEVLTYLRSTFSFIREKPPVQYTIIKLLHNVIPQFQDPTRERGETYEIATDMIYDKAKILFPSWCDYDAQTIQIKRRWIREALEKLFALRLIGKPVGKPNSWLIPIPTIKTRGPIHSALCKKLAKNEIKQKGRRSRRGRPRSKPLKLRAHPKTTKLDSFY
jgi:hypothetical protein